MDLFACGFNAHGQLATECDESFRDDIHTFTKLVSGKYVQILFAGWANTILQVDSTLYLLGNLYREQLALPIVGLTKRDIIKLFVGHAHNPLGALTMEGRFLRLHQYPHIHLKGGGNDAPLISHIAYADNTRVSVVLKADHDHHNICVLEFKSDVDLISWYDGCSNHTSINNPNLNHFTIPGRATHLVAGATSFALLNDSGEVFTWGDPRYPKSLARVLSAETPAEVPCLVDYLAGIPIAKVDAQGWLFGALTRDKDLYLWGSTGPGACPHIPDLPDLGDDMKLVEHEAAEYVHDFGIGRRSVLMLVGDGVYGVGDNRSGQLGAGMGKDWVMEWTKPDMPNSGPFVALHCGPETSFAIAQRE